MTSKLISAVVLVVSVILIADVTCSRRAPAFGLLIMDSQPGSDDSRQPGAKLIPSGLMHYKSSPIYRSSEEDESDWLASDDDVTEAKRPSKSRLFVGRRGGYVVEMATHKRKKRSTDEFPASDSSSNNHNTVLGAIAENPSGTAETTGHKSGAFSEVTKSEPERHEINQDGPESKESEEVKRSRMFVGKREEEDTDDYWSKRSRMFVGKRSRMFVGKRTDEEAKRSRMFVGKKSDSDEASESSSDESSVDEETSKRSRMFVGKRPYDDDEEDDAETKRSPKFVGKRLPKFVGKRSPKFVGKRTQPKLLFGKRAQPKLLFGKRSEYDELDMEKKSRMFVGKREEDDESESAEESSSSEDEATKRSRMFVGKRNSKKMPTIYFGKRLTHEAGDLERLLTEERRKLMDDKKRSRMFVGKRYGEDINEDDKRSLKFVGKGVGSGDEVEDGNEYESNEEEEYNEGDEDVKRSRMFVGKRPVPGFVGKRKVPGFVGKRPVPGFVGKRPAPGFVGRR